MKSIAYIVCLSFFYTTVANALVLDDLAGIYQLTTKKQIEFLGPGMTVEYKLAIDKSKDEFGNNIVGINEYIKQTVGISPPVIISEAKCWGTAELSKSNLMTADFSCPNQRVFEQEIDFSKMVTAEDGTFTAPVYTSLYYSKIEMTFEKLKIVTEKK